MSWLKEDFGCSDEELFEKIEFDLLVRKALGIEHISNAAPSLDTYYLFRRRICDYYEKTGVDLMQKCFEQVTGSLVKQLKISGKCIRMDSKLIGSNIARQSRYELIHATLVKFLKANVLDRLQKELRKQIESLPPDEQHKRNNVEAFMFQYSFHTRNGKTRYRGLLKNRMQAYARMNLRRVVRSLLSAFQRTIFALFGPLRGALGWLVMIFANLFTEEAFCRISPRMAVSARPNLKSTTF